VVAVGSPGSAVEVSRHQRPLTTSATRMPFPSVKDMDLASWAMEEEPIDLDRIMNVPPIGQKRFSEC